MVNLTKTDVVLIVDENQQALVSCKSAKVLLRLQVAAVASLMWMCRVSFLVNIRTIEPKPIPISPGEVRHTGMTHFPQSNMSIECDIKCSGKRGQLLYILCNLLAELLMVRWRGYKSSTAQPFN